MSPEARRTRARAEKRLKRRPKPGGRREQELSASGGEAAHPRRLHPPVPDRCRQKCRGPRLEKDASGRPEGRRRACILTGTVCCRGLKRWYLLL